VTLHLMLDDLSPDPDDDGLAVVEDYDDWDPGEDLRYELAVEARQYAWMEGRER